MKKGVDILLCYARKDQALIEDLKIHLIPLQRQGLVSIWYDMDISPGTEWEEEIRNHLDTAHIILLLISPNFMASEYCYSKEMTRAMERHERGEVRVIPVILRFIYWQGAPFGKLQVLPKNARPITKWQDRNHALFDVAEGIRRVAEELISSEEQEMQIRQAKSASIWAQIRAQAEQEMQPSVLLDYIWIIDSSYSMKGDKIQSLNTAVREFIPYLKKAADSNSHAIRVHAITFSTGAYWHASAPLENFQWPDVTAGGERDIGQALSKVAEYLSLLCVIRKRGLPPVLVLISDGYPTDNFEHGLSTLMAQPWARKAVRIAIGIGSGAPYELLQQFIGHSEIKPLQANNAEELLVQYIKWDDETIENTPCVPLPPNVPLSPSVPLDPNDVW